VRTRLLASGEDTAGGAVTIGARSTLVTVMAVLAEPESALAAVNVTVWLPASL
jgi:hypothetical protein